MKLRHRTPCKECPWRTSSLQGYVGGYDPVIYADAVASNRVTACHMHDHGPTSDRTAFCAGALSVMANACIQPDEGEPGQEGARAAVIAVGKNSNTFMHPRYFYEYHAGKEYIPFIIRMMKERNDVA